MTTAAGLPGPGDTNEIALTTDASDGSPPGGWRLPAHIRKAHWHCVRIAEHDANGKVIGTLHGTQGTDWHYELRWYPPTSVNADHGPNPTVRDPLAVSRCSAHRAPPR